MQLHPKKVIVISQPNEPDRIILTEALPNGRDVSFTTDAQQGINEVRKLFGNGFKRIEAIMEVKDNA